MRATVDLGSRISDLGSRKFSEEASHYITSSPHHFITSSLHPLSTTHPRMSSLSPMATVHSVLESLEDIAPARYAFDYDKVGLQVGEQHTAVTRGVVSLDRSIAAVEFAVSIGAQVVIAHHPLIFKPID